MKQKHSIILWKKAEREERSFKEISKEIYEVLSLFQDFPTNLRPNFLPGKSPNDIKKFEWNLQNFSDVLFKEGANREGNTVFEELGYSISFFSSLNDQDSCAFNVTAGNKCEKFYNTLIINLPLSLNIFDRTVSEMINSMFERLVKAYRPFWGCVSNKALSKKYGRYLEGNLPTTVYWINYWSEDIISAIGIKKIQDTIEKNTSTSFQDGIFKIGNIALDVDKEADMMFHEALQRQLF